MYSRVTCWGDKVEECVDAVVAEAGVALDARLLGKNVVVLPFEVSDNLGEATNNHHSVVSTSLLLISL